MTKHWKTLLCFVLAIFTIIALSMVCVPNAYAANNETPIAISSGQYDSYTNSDTHINNYNINQRSSSVAKFGKELLLSAWHDDDIVKIIPRELFTRNGDYLYIGKEYGFFVHTFSDSYFDSETDTYSVATKNKHSYVLVFNITNNTSYQNTDTVQITVSPLFQYEYAYIDVSESYLTLNGASGYDLSGYRKKALYDISEESADNFVVLCPRYGTSVIYRQEERYYLKDISFALSLYNEQALNEGDNGYQAINDEGSFFLNVDYKYNGIVRERGEFPVKETITFAKDAAKLILTNGASKVASALKTILKLTDFASGIENTINLVSGINNFVNPSDVATGNGAITATYLQSDLNNELIKGVGATINTDNAESVWYKVGNSCSITAQTMNTAKGHEPNYTRLNREIGLKIVDVADDSTVTAGLTSEQLQMFSPVYETIEVDQPNDVILLPNGVNYYEFTPSYASHYRFDFETDNGCALYVDGTKIENSSDFCDVYLAPNIRHRIEVRNQSGVSNRFTVTPKVYDELNQEFSVKPNEEYVLKLNVIGIRAWTLSDADFLFTAYYRNYINDASKTVLGATQEVVLRKAPDELLYIVVKNTSSVEKSVRLTDSDVLSLTLDNKETFNISAIDTYVSFEAPMDGTYYLAIITDELYTGSVYCWDGTDIKVTVSTFNKDKYQINMEAGTKIYFRFRSFNGETIAISAIMKKYSYTIFWYKEQNGHATQIGNEVSIEAGSNVKLYILMDNVTKIKPNNVVWHCGADFQNGLVINEENININADCPLGTLLNLGAAFVTQGFYYAGDAAINSRLEVTIIPPLTDNFDRFENSDNLGFYWNSTPYVKNIEYSFSDGHGFYGTQYATRNNLSALNTDASNYVDLLGLNYTSFYDITISINKITYVDYLGISRTIEMDSYSHTVPSVFNNRLGSYAEIACLRHFQNIAKIGLNNVIKTYNQIADITINNPIATTNPIANMIFNKTYNGNDFILYTYYYDTTSTQLYVGGFCGSNRGTIENLNLISIIITKNASFIGGITAFNWGTIQNCTVDTLITVEDSEKNPYVGGVAGSVRGTLKNVEVRPYITSRHTTGGLAGFCSNATIQNCHVGINRNLSDYGPSDIYIKKYADIAVGGLIGNVAADNSKISNCTATIGIHYAAPVSNDTNNLIAPKIGGVVGWKQGGTLSNVTFHGTISTGNLKVLSYGFLGLTKFDQKQNVSNYIGYSS